MSYSPLVSVIIITYNSAKYVLDALESVKDQSYKNIELIVSDDGSKDDTVQICKGWIESNKSRFVKAILITVEKNTGTSANCNRGLAKCNGEWIKLFAGDDALFPNCIEDFVVFISNNPDAKFVLGNIREYMYTFDVNNMVEKKDMHFHNNDPILDKTAEEQFKRLILGNSFIPPSVFYNAQVVKNLGGYDEKYGIYEDTPFYAKLLKAGYKIYGLNKDVQKYRTSNTNIYANTTYLFNYQHVLKRFQFQKDVCFPYYTRKERNYFRLYFGVISIMNTLGLKRRTFFNRAFEGTMLFFGALLTLNFKNIRRLFKKAMSFID